MISFLFDRHKQERQAHCHEICDHDGDPHTVDLPDHGKKQNRADLKHERAQKRNERRGKTVVECGKEARAEDRESHKNKRASKDTEAMHRHRHQAFAVADEDHRKRTGKKLCRHEHEYTAQAKKRQAFFQNTLHLLVIARAVMVADDGRGADGIADEDGGKNEADVHHDTVSRDTVLARIFQKLNIVKHTDNAHGYVAHKFGRAVHASLADRSQLKSRFSETEKARILIINSGYLR